VYESAWMVKTERLTTFSRNGCGARSSTKKCICTSTTVRVTNKIGRSLQSKDEISLRRPRFWQWCLPGLVVLFLAYNTLTNVAYSVDKHYNGAIYVQNQVVKRVQVTVIGKIYIGLFRSNEFIGSVQIDEVSYPFHTFRQWRLFGVHFPYPYVGVSTDVRGNHAVLRATIEMSGNLDSLVASTDSITKQYGKQAKLKASSS